MDPSGLRRLASVLPLATMTMLASAAAETPLTEAASLRTRQGIVVDANDADWKDVPGFALPYSRSMPSPYGREPATSDPDCSATFMSQWSDDYLYFLVVVHDDARKGELQWPLFRNDSVEVYLDGKGERASAYDGNDFQIFIDIHNRLAINDSGGAADGTSVLHAAREVAGGHVVELAVPWSMLQAAPGAGVQIGFDLAVNDNDRGENARDTQLMWNGNGMEYADPQQFGALVLSDVANGGETSVYACGSAGAAPLAVAFVLGLLGLRGGRRSVKGDVHAALLECARRLRRLVQRELAKQRSPSRTTRSRPLGRTWRQRASRSGAAPDGTPSTL